MSLYNYLPVLDENMHQEASGKCYRDIDYVKRRCFEISCELRSRKKIDNLICVSLFKLEGPDFESISEKSLHNEKGFGKNGEKSFWEYYVVPLMHYSKLISELSPTTGVRIYISKNLEFLIPYLFPYADVVVMASNTSSISQGVGWRYKALADHPGCVTFLKASAIGIALDLAEITKSLAAHEMSVWRTPSPKDIVNGILVYRPIMSIAWGTNIIIDIEDLTHSYFYALEKKMVRNIGYHPIEMHPRYMEGRADPVISVGEILLASAVYPRLAVGGVFTLLPPITESQLVFADIEFAGWLNSNSSISYDLFACLLNNSPGSVIKGLIRGPSIRSRQKRYYRGIVTK